MRKRLPTGIDRVCLAYVRHYGPNAKAVLQVGGSQFVFPKAESKTLFDWALALGQSGNPLPAICKGLVTGCMAQNAPGRILFNVGHSGLESNDYMRVLEKRRLKPIFMVHDLIPITHPQYCRAGEQSRHMLRMRNAMQAACGIICNSQATLQAVASLCQEQQWVMPPSVVALLAPEPATSALTAIAEPSPYFVYVSTIEPRKNHLLLLKAWLKLSEQLGSAAPRLVIIGQKGWGYTAVMDLLAGSDVLQKLVTHVPDCSDADMAAYLQHARAMLFPSFTEGFGMPVVEALTQGLPVIASDLPVFREFAGDIPDYIDALDEDLWVQTIASYSQPWSKARSDQLIRLKRFEAPGWAEHFAAVDSFLAAIAAGHCAA